MRFLARIIAEIIQFATLVLTGLNGYWTWRAYDDAAKSFAKANGVGNDVPTVFGQNAVLFFLSATVLSLGFFLFASMCRAILETARNTERLMEIMEARNPDA
jgi:hypothetical protein